MVSLCTAILVETEGAAPVASAVPGAASSTGDLDNGDAAVGGDKLQRVASAPFSQTALAGVVGSFRNYVLSLHKVRGASVGVP